MRRRRCSSSTSLIHGGPGLTHYTLGLPKINPEPGDSRTESKTEKTIEINADCLFSEDSLPQNSLKGQSGGNFCKDGGPHPF